MASQRDVKNRISSIKNIEKITRAMEMVAAAGLRRAEQRIAALRPYASAIRRMTRQGAEAAENIPNLPILEEHDSVDTVGLLLVTGDRGLAGPVNSPLIRAGPRGCRPCRATVGWAARSTRRYTGPACGPRPSTRRRAARCSGTRPGAAA